MLVLSEGRIRCMQGPANLFFFLQLHGPAAVLNRKFLHDLTTARHFKIFCNMHNKNIYSENWKNSSCTATLQCAREHFSHCAAAHPRSLEGTLAVCEWYLFPKFWRNFLPQSSESNWLARSVTLQWHAVFRVPLLLSVIEPRFLLLSASSLFVVPSHFTTRDTAFLYPLKMWLIGSQNWLGRFGEVKNHSDRDSKKIIRFSS
jgi:hypothetical protein